MQDISKNHQSIRAQSHFIDVWDLIYYLEMQPSMVFQSHPTVMDEMEQKYINSERRQVRRSVQSDALPFNKKIWDEQELSVKIVVR
jgi:hypothetical protein